MADKTPQSSVDIVVRHKDAPDDPTRLIPASRFHSVFSAVYFAMRESWVSANGGAKFEDDALLISDLRIGSNVATIAERQPSAIPAFHRAMQSVYNGEFASLLAEPSLVKRIAAIGKSINTNYITYVSFADAEEIPMDGFFASQAKRLTRASSDTRTSPPRHYCGTAVGTFEGRLVQLDYSGATWKGILRLSGGSSEIECTFDKRRGADFYNPYGDKVVSVTGNAIYTGEGPLPERIGVISIEAIPVAHEFQDFRGSLKASVYDGWTGGLENIDKQ